MSVHTRSQKLAQKAYAQIAGQKLSKEFVSFAKKFPALIHTCGLAQAVAFAMTKERDDYLTDLAEVLKFSGHEDIENLHALAQQTREQPVSGYLRLSRDAIDAANWLKRYVEALEEETPNAK